MKRVLLILAGIHFLATNSFCQELSRQEADSMIKVLSRTKSGIDRMELLLSLAQFHIFKTGENKSDLDSAAVYIDKAKGLIKTINSPDARGYLLLTESYLVKERGPKLTVYPYFISPESKEMVERAIKILEIGTNKGYLAQACYALSTYYNYEDSLQAVKKMQLLKQSADIFQEAGDLIGKGRSLEMLGDMYYLWGEQDKSMQTLKEALASYNSANFPGLQEIYVLIGRSYYYKHDHVPALSNLLKALKIAQSVKGSSFQLCQINNFLGMLYNDIDRQDMAAKYLTEALQIAQENNAEDDMFAVLENLSVTYNSIGQYRQSLKVLGLIPKQFLTSKSTFNVLGISLEYLRAYMGLKQLNKARGYCEVLLDIADNKLDHEKIYDYTLIGKTRVYMYAADFYFLDKQFTKARYYLTKSGIIAKEINYEFAQMHNLELLYKLDSAQGNVKSAFNHLIRYKQKTDSVSSERKIRQFQMMNVEYEVAMKEDSIKLKDNDILFLKQKTDLQQANLKQAGLVRNLTIAGAILLLILLGLIYNRYLHKQKTNHLLESQKEVIDKSNHELQHLNEQQTKLLVEKDWLVKEIHHRVKNNLQMVVSLLNAQTEFLTHPSALGAIKESRERMQAIAIIHQKLYQFDNSTVINMRAYINELADNIKDSFADSDRIRFTLDIDDVDLDISQSVPLGLIMNEAITNAIKYAFPKNERGWIQISLNHLDTDRLQLKIADNGKGLPAEVDLKHSNSLGMKLIRLFSEQLEGDLYFLNNNGLEIVLNFKAAVYHDAATHKIIA